MSDEGTLRSEVIAADFFERLGYSTVWEDERIVEEALRPGPGERVLSITSGGDLSLGFLLRGVEEVISLDFNPRQSILLELKSAALRRLDPDELWRFLGLLPCRRRLALYGLLRADLSPDARRYWDAQRRTIRSGVLRCGRQDRYLHLVGRALRMLQGRRRVRALFEAPDLETQRAAFDRGWTGRRWRLLWRVLYSRPVLDRAFHRDHFRYAVGEHPALALRGQVERVLRDLPVAENPYIHWAVFGSYPDRERCPAWLRRSGHPELRSRLERLRIETGELEQRIGSLSDHSVDCFNFSNIFDWVSEEGFLALMRQVVRVARPGARLCYWTNLVNARRDLQAAARELPRLREEVELAAQLFEGCRTPGYSACTIGLVD